MKWNFENGRLSFSADNTNLFSMKELTGRVELDGTFVAADDCAAHGVRWIWDVRETEAGLVVRATLKNESASMIRIGVWDVLYGKTDSLELGDNKGDVRFFCWWPWSVSVENFAVDKKVSSTTLCLLTEKTSCHTLQIAYTTVDRMNVSHYIKYENGSVTDFASTCSACRFRLEPGCELASEELLIRYYNDPYMALEDWADGINRRYQPCFDGTVKAVFSCSAQGRDFSETMEKRAAAVKREFGKLGPYQLVGGTHSIIKGGLPGHWLQFEDNVSGVPYPELLKKYHAQGETFKFWFSPFWFFGEAEETLEENRENLLKDKDGNPITRSFANGWELGRGRYAYEPLTKYFLDGTHPKTKDYLRKVFSAYREMGCRSYMMDFLSIIPGAVRYDENLLPVEASREIFRVIREAAGWDTHIQTAVASSPAFVGCINSARVVRDYGEGRPQHPFPNWRNATHCRHDLHFANYHSFLQNAAAAYFTNYKVYVNDLNVLLLDHPVPADQARINVTIFGLSGDSPVSVADDLDNMLPERLRMLKMCFPRTSGIPKPVDLFDRTSEDGGCRILMKKVEADYDSYTLAAVFNTANDAPAVYTDRIDLARLGCDPEKEYRIYEFWNGEYLGTYKRTFPCAVPAADCRLYRICEAREYPWLIGTDLHVEQGRAEVKELMYDEATKTLRGIACRPAGEQGRLVFLMPRHLKLVFDPSISANTMKEVTDMQTVISLNVRFTADEMPFELRFETMDTEFVSRRGWLPYATGKEWLDYVAAHQEEQDPDRVIR